MRCNGTIASLQFLYCAYFLHFTLICFTSTPLYFTSHSIYFTSNLFTSLRIQFTSLQLLFTSFYPLIISFHLISSSSWRDSEELSMVLLDRGKGKRPIKVREIFSGQELVQPRHQSFNVVKQPTVTHGEITKKRDVVGRHRLFMYPLCRSRGAREDRQSSRIVSPCRRVFARA